MRYAEQKEKYSQFLSRRDARRQVVTFWDGVLPPPELISLEAGLPNEQLFPLRGIDLHLVDRPFEDRDGQLVSLARYAPAPALPLARSLQYSEVAGMEPVRAFCRALIERTNRPAYDEWDVLLAGGSSDSMFKVFETLCDESTTVLMEEFTFSPTVSNVTATGASCVPLRMCLSSDPDKQGIDVEYMAALLDGWAADPRYRHLNKPRVLYTIATGQNPTGMTLSRDKRRQIYALAQKHDLLIVEDDPYGCLSYPPYDATQPMRNVYTDSEAPLTLERYLAERLVPSFLTVDTDARVVRLETFSKMYAPGLRLSYIVANRFLIERLLNLTEITTRAPSGASQAIVHATVQAMGERESGSGSEMDRMVHGWLRWAMKLAGTYTHRRNVACRALYETAAYAKGLFSVLEPSAGMFINLRITWPPGAVPDDMAAAMERLDKTLVKNSVKVVLGYKMAVDQEFSLQASDFIRITVSYVSHDEQLVEACHRIGAGIEEFLA